MHLMVIGLNHRTAPVEIRERFSMTKDVIREGLRHLSDYTTLHEAVVLSTCNRSEIYAVVEDDIVGTKEIKQFFADFTANTSDIDDYLYIFSDAPCIRHLFYVVSSLDSLVIGEGQILSQVKDAYSIARGEKATSTILNTLFNRAIATGKRVRAETRIAFSAVSISYAAVELAREIFGSLEKSAVLIFGAGKMGELTVRHLIDKGAKKIYVANRHRERAEEVAKKFGGEVIDFTYALQNATDIDIIITSTGSLHYVVKPWETQRLMVKRNARPLVFIDIALPRDVDPDVAEIKGVKLYNIDNLKEVVDEHKEERAKEAKVAEKIIEEELEEILDRFQYLAVQPLMALLSKRADRIKRRELKKALVKLKNINQEEQKIIEHMAKMIVRKILRHPMMALNEASGTEEETFYAEAMRKLFQLASLHEEEEDEKRNNHWYEKK